MLLAIPAFFSSCQEDAPQIDYTMSVTVVNDFSKVVDAINNGTLKNEQAIAQLTAAIDKMNADQQTKLQAIKDVLNSVNATIERHARQDGFSVVRDLAGHGTGNAFHEDPVIDHYDRKNFRYRRQ